MTIRFLLILSLVLNPLTSMAGLKDEAEKSIRISHEYAKNTAASLVIQDMDTLMIDMSKTPIFSNPTTANILQDIQDLGKNLQAEIDKADTIQAVNVEALNSLLKTYRALVRQRFKASFTAQQMVYDREQAVRVFELLFKKFNNTCQSGRSDIDLGKKLPILPRIPEAQYGFNFGLGVGTDIGGGNTNETGSRPRFNEVKFDASSITANPASEERNKAGNLLYGATGLAVSISVSGASGATVAMAAAAAPYMLGASLAVAVALAAISSHEQMLLENELADANVNLFLRSANDQDIAKYYQEYCATIGDRFVKIQKKLSLFSYSEDTRRMLTEQVVGSRPLRSKLRQDSLNIQSSRNLIQLVEYDKAGLCLTSVEKKENTPCVRTGRLLKATYTSASFDPESEEDRKSLAKAEADLLIYKNEYPQERMMDLYSDEVIDLLLNNWNNITTTLNNLNLNSIDVLMGSLAQRVQSYIIEVQRAKNSSWNQGVEFLGAESKYQNEFESYRTEFFKLLGKSVLVLFGKTDAIGAKKSFADFKKRYEVFATKVFLNQNIQSLSLSVKSLGAFYANL